MSSPASAAAPYAVGAAADGVTTPALSAAAKHNVNPTCRNLFMATPVSPIV